MKFIGQNDYPKHLTATLKPTKLTAIRLPEILTAIMKPTKLTAIRLPANSDGNAETESSNGKKATKRATTKGKTAGF